MSLLICYNCGVQQLLLPLLNAILLVKSHLDSRLELSPITQLLMLVLVLVLQLQELPLPSIPAQSQLDGGISSIVIIQRDKYS